jgi:hypothetical protein
VDVGRESADEIDADRRGARIHRARERDEVRGTRCGRDEGDRRRRDALVDDRDAVIPLDRVGDRDEVLRVVDDLRVDLLARALDVRIGAVEQVDAERRRADVERLELDHPDGLEDLLVGEGHRRGSLATRRARTRRRLRAGCVQKESAARPDRALAADEVELCSPRRAPCVD